MNIKEISLKKLNPDKFIEAKVQEISSTIGDSLAMV